jgi:hypothetical protein
MPEFDHPHWTQGAPAALFDRGVVQRDLYILVALFLVDKEIHGLSNDAVCGIANENLEHEVGTRLMSTAAILRAWDDQLAQMEDPSEAVARLRGRTCGELEEVIGSGRVVGLTLREACNKIIHAERVTFDVDEHPVTRQNHANPKIYLYGSRGRQQWRATVDIIEYAAIGAFYTNG